MVIHQRIADLRIQNGMTLQALADRTGTTKSQIDKLEKGERRLTVDWLIKLADALGISPAAFFEAGGPSVGYTLQEPSRADYLTTPASPVTPALHIPVYGRADPVTDQLHQMDKVVSHVPCPPTLAGVPDAFGVYMVGDGMEPRFFAGELLLVDPSRPVTKNCFVVVLFHDESAQVRQFLHRSPGLLYLRQLVQGDDPPLAVNRVRGVYRIVGVMDA